MIEPGVATSPLTPRQLEVLELMAKGLTNREIAEVLGISAGTVKIHVAAVIAALDVTNRTEATAALHELGLGSAAPSTEPPTRVPGFGDRPAIAVLPFSNLSSEAEHEHLARWISEDLLTGLATWRWFPVIAAHRGTADFDPERDAREASRQLGARYLVGGSVRSARQSIRVSVQVTDGQTGELLWLERYDRRSEELLTLESEITDTIVASLEPAIVRIQGSRAAPRTTEHLGAWDCLQRGFFRITGGSRGDFLEGRALFARALEIDAGSALGYGGIALTGILELLHQTTPSPSDAERRALRAAERAAALDRDEPIAHMALGWAYTAVRDFERAFGALERATDLNPSLAWAHLAHGTARAAAAPELQREAIDALERAIRLSPRDPFLHWMWTALGSAQSNRGAFPEARAAFETARKLAPDQPHVYPMLAATFVAMGDLERARASVAEARKLAPRYSPIAHARRFGLAPTLPIYAAALAAAGWEDPGGPFDPSG